MNIYRTIISTAAKIDSGNIPNLDSADVVQNVLNIFYFVSGTTAVIAILVSAFYFITSGDNQTNVAKARYIIQYAAIGLVVIFGAFIITNFIIGRLQ